MKRTIALLMALCMIFLTPLSAHATELAGSSPKKMIGYFTDENGNTTEIIGELISTQNTNARTGTFSATYQYKIPRASGSNTVDSPDSGYSSHVYLTVHYQIKDGLFYLLTAVSGYWEIQDSRVSVISSTVDYTCMQSQSHYNRPVNNNFYFTTGFTNYTPDNGTYSNVGAHLHLTYLMGTSRTWSFTLSNFIL